MRSFSPRVSFALAIAVLVVGVFLRFWQLDRMFAQYDDLFPIAGPYVMNQGHPKHVSVPYTGGRLGLTVDAQTIKHNPVLYGAYVSTATYAPLQFVSFPFVLSGDYSYRQFLFRGRLPSAIFSSLALVMFLVAYLAYAPAIDMPGVLGLACLTFSLLNITYAQQSTSYAVGVFGAITLLALLGRMAAAKTTSRGLIGWAAVCATLAYFNYQVGVLVGMAYIALALSEWQREGVAGIRILWRRYLGSVACFVMLVTPLAIPLHDKSSAVGQFRGLSGFDRFFPHVTGSSLGERTASVLTYAGSAAYRLIETNVLFSIGSPVTTICVALLFALVLVGGWSVARRTDGAGRALAIFALGVGLLIAVLNGAGQFPISPTRHMLVFSPLVALLVAMGARRVRPSIVRDGGIAILLAIIAVTFAWHYNEFRAPRTDRFDEQSLASLLDEHQVDTIVSYGSTWNPTLMFRTGQRHVNVIDLDAIVRKGDASLVQLPHGPFLLVSQTLPVHDYSANYPYQGPPLTLPGYDVRELVRIDSNVEIGISNDVKLGGNGLYLSIAEPRAVSGGAE